MRRHPRAKTAYSLVNMAERLGRLFLSASQKLRRSIKGPKTGAATSAPVNSGSRWSSVMRYRSRWLLWTSAGTMPYVAHCDGLVRWAEFSRFFRLAPRDERSGA